MSRRPGRIRSVVDIELPRPRESLDETDAAFLDHVRRLRALLREE
jgi:hypothetical protein